MRTRFRLPLVVVISILPGVFGNLSAQETKPQPTQCSVVRVLKNGSIQVQIDGTSYLAITADQARENLKLKADLETAQNLIRLKDAEIASHNQEIDRYERTLNLKNETLGDKNEALTLKNDAIEQLKSLRDDYRELADTYRKAQGGKWFSISARSWSDLGERGGGARWNRHQTLSCLGIRPGAQLRCHGRCRVPHILTESNRVLGSTDHRSGSNTKGADTLTVFREQSLSARLEFVFEGWVQK